MYIHIYTYIYTYMYNVTHVYHISFMYKLTIYTINNTIICQINNMLTNSESRFGHRSGFCESSRQNSDTISGVFAFRNCLVSTQINIYSKHWRTYMFCQKLISFCPRYVLKKDTKTKRLGRTCSTVNRTWGYQYTYKWYLY